jgi:hypothetical protein
MLIIGYSRARPAPAGLGVKTFVAYSDHLQTAARPLVLPAGVSAGSTLVAAVRFGTSGTAPAITGVPAGWSLVGSDMSSTGFFVYKKTADGTEGGTTATWTASLSCTSVFLLAEVTGAAGEVAATFAPASLEPPPHAPAGGSADRVWIAATSVRSNANDVAAAPPGYAGLAKEWTWEQGRSHSGQATIAGAYRQATAASEAPGAFTWTGIVSSGPQAATISVR